MKKPNRFQSIIIVISIVLIPFLTGFYFFSEDSTGMVTKVTDNKSGFINLGYVDGVEVGNHFLVYRPYDNYKHFITVVKITEVKPDHSKFSATLSIGKMEIRDIVEMVKVKYNYLKGNNYYLDQAEKDINNARFNDAFVNLYISILIKRKNPAAYIDMAYLFFRANDLENAKTLLDTAKAMKNLSPDYRAFMYNMYGTYYLERNEFGPAEINFEKTMKLGERCNRDDFSNSYLLMGALFYKAGNHLASKTFYQEAILKNPNWLGALESFISSHFDVVKVIGRSFKQLKVLSSI
ncbi:hypothetical protein KAJ27_05970 [bacterium]|nr:hypothetical protein [bacterium]